MGSCPDTDIDPKKDQYQYPKNLFSGTLCQVVSVFSCENVTVWGTSLLCSPKLHGHTRAPLFNLQNCVTHITQLILN